MTGNGPVGLSKPCRVGSSHVHRRSQTSAPGHRPGISVLVPCYNYGRFLRACVQSILSQTGVDVEVVVLDDASDDETPEVAAALAAADQRVRVLHHERNLGPVATFNELLQWIRQEYSVLISADDLLTPGALARATSLLETHPSVGFVYGHPAHFAGHHLPPARARVRSWTVWSGAEWLALRCRRGVNCISSPEVVARSSLVRSLGELRPELPHTADMEMWMRMAAVADVGRVDGPDQAWYRVHPQSLQRTVHAGVLVDMEQRRDAFAWTFAGPGGLLPAAAELHDSARRALAAEALDRACQAYDRGRTAELPISQLVDFAVRLWPDASALPQWRALNRRLRLSRYPYLMPTFTGRAVLRRAIGESQRRRWRRTGL